MENEEIKYIAEDFYGQGIYEIKNNKTGQCYYGSAGNLNKRIKDHIRYLKRNSHNNIKLQSSFNKYGSENFSARVISRHPDISRDELYDIEQKILDDLDFSFHFNISTNAIIPDNSRSIVGKHIVTGEEISYDSISSASKDGFIPNEVSRVARGVTGQHGNYRWRYEEDADFAFKGKIKTTVFPIVKVDLASGEVLKAYMTKNELRQDFINTVKFDINKIYRVMKRKLGRKSYLGFDWQYHDPILKEHFAKLYRETDHGQKIVEQLDLITGRVIAEFPSTSATKESGFNPLNVSSVCRGERMKHKGYGWRYKDDDSYPEFKPKKKTIGVECYNLSTGAVIVVYESYREAVEAGYNKSNISKAVNAKVPYRGLGWRRITTNNPTFEITS